MTQREAARALRNLARAARMLSELAVSRGMRGTAARADEVADTLDAAFDLLGWQGADYLDAAEAFVSASTDVLLNLACAVGRCPSARA